MDAEFSVELGADDPTLAVPWRSPNGEIEYVDLRKHPEAIDRLEEMRAFPELGEFLRRLNAAESAYQTAKCDAWFDSLMDVDDDPYEEGMKCGSYVDVFFAGARRLADFAEHERWAREVVRRVRGAEDLQARAEIAVRRAWFEDENPGEGFYWTIYVFGYGEGVEDARGVWVEAIRQVQDALLSM